MARDGPNAIRPNLRMLLGDDFIVTIVGTGEEIDCYYEFGRIDSGEFFPMDLHEYGGDSTSHYLITNDGKETPLRFFMKDVKSVEHFGRSFVLSKLPFFQDPRLNKAYGIR